MSKKIIYRKKNTGKQKYRKINIDSDQGYNDEELKILLAELKAQMEQMDIVREKYYSTNEYIDRISERTFLDILREKLREISQKKSLNKKN